MIRYLRIPNLRCSTWVFESCSVKLGRCGKQSTTICFIKSSIQTIVFPNHLPRHTRPRSSRQKSIELPIPACPRLRDYHFPADLEAHTPLCLLLRSVVEDAAILHPFSALVFAFKARLGTRLSWGVWPTSLALRSLLLRTGLADGSFVTF